jgi:hypothetical protein
MATLSVKIDEQTVAHYTDKIVRRLDDFPELVRALRDGDLLTGRSFCARLFDGDARRNHLGELTPTLQAAMKAL